MPIRLCIELPSIRGIRVRATESKIYSRSPLRFLIRRLGYKRSSRGIIPWNIGKHMSEESKLKMSKAHKGKPKPWIRGENNGYWKNGASYLHNAIRGMLEFRTWRTTIYQRDSYTCRVCGVLDMKDNKLNAHHIIPLVKIINDYDIKSVDDARK